MTSQLNDPPAERHETADTPAPPPDEGRQHLAFVHALRGVASLLVVWAHLGTIWPLTYGYEGYLHRATIKLLVLPFRVFQDGGHLGVLLFFLVSGYIITYTSLREDRTSFAVKRVLRLGPPLLAATAVAWAYIRISAATGTPTIIINDVPWTTWVQSVFLLDGWLGPRLMSVTWTLVIEVMFYALTFVLLGLTRRRPEVATWAMTGLWALTCVFISAAPVLSTSLNAERPAFVAFLIVGRCIYLWQAGLIRPITAALNAATAAVVFASLTEYVQPGLIGGSTSPYAEPYWTYAYAIIIFLALMSAAPRRTVQPFTLLGDISYSLYLTHMPVGFLVFDTLDRYGVPVDVMVLVAIAASIVVAWVGYHLVERPSQKLARDLLRRRRSSTRS